MRNLIHLTRASAALAVLALAGILATQGQAARKDYFKQPKLRLGLLTVIGTEGSDRIGLRLRAGDPDVVEVDVGDDGTADFSFKRRKIETVIVAGLGGDDAIRIDESNGAFTDTIRTVLAGGGGNDTLIGGSGAETLLGGDGNDSIDGNRGNDLSVMGAGDDTFTWDQGDGSDTIEGQDGNDTMVFNGANLAEKFDLSANGSRLRFFRDLGNITMDTAGVENVDVRPLGAADQVTVDDLRGTDVKSVNVDLAGSPGGSTGDGAADRVIVDGTDGNDTINVNGDTSGLKVSGLASTVEVLHSEAAKDSLEINTRAGSDTVDSRGLADGTVQLFVNGVLVP